MRILFVWLACICSNAYSQIGLKEFIIGEEMEQGYYISTLGGIKSEFAVSTTIRGKIKSIYCLIGLSYSNNETHAASYVEANKKRVERRTIFKEDVELIKNGLNEKFGIFINVNYPEKRHPEFVYKERFTHSGNEYIFVFYVSPDLNTSVEKYWVNVSITSQTLEDMDIKEREMKKLNDF
ncbi:MAG: hypothetical protein HC819_18015 [Cyclobacteriaceae bacterium]|nr:hypothetical protein [Cyclobacteriaceae bacterium]